MKRISLILGILLILSGITIAQERGGGQRPSRSTEQRRPGDRGDRPMLTPEQRVARQTQMLVEQLKLDKEQEAKVTVINKKYVEKQSFDRSKMRDASEAERTKMREEMMKIQAEKEKEIKAILTSVQLKQYDEMLKKREEIRKNNQGRWREQGQ